MCRINTFNDNTEIIRIIFCVCEIYCNFQSRKSNTKSIYKFHILSEDIVLSQNIFYLSFPNIRTSDSHTYIHILYVLHITDIELSLHDNISFQEVGPYLSNCLTGYGCHHLSLFLIGWSLLLNRLRVNRPLFIIIIILNVIFINFQIYFY